MDEGANKLAKTLLLVLPLLLELVVLLLELPFKEVAADGASSKVRGGFSGNSAISTKSRKELNEKGKLKARQRIESIRLYFMRALLNQKNNQ